MATRGKPIVHLTNQTTILHGAVRAHSRKPEEFYQLVEALCPAPRYASFFHCGPTRPNFDAHGDEAQGVTLDDGLEIPPPRREHSRKPDDVRGAAEGLDSTDSDDGLDIPGFLRRPLPRGRAS